MTLFALADWRTADRGQRTLDSGWMEASRLHKKRQNFQTKQEITKHATKIAKTNRISEQNRVVGVAYGGERGCNDDRQTDDEAAAAWRTLSPGAPVEVGQESEKA